MFAGTAARNRISISPKVDSHDFLETRYISTKIFCDFVDLDPYGKERQDEEEGICQLTLLVYFPINDENRPCKLSSCCGTVGSSDGQEWLWENQYAVDNFRQLYRKRHEKIRRNK